MPPVITEVGKVSDSNTLTLTYPCAVGTYLYVATVAVVSSVTDSQGNTYTQRATQGAVGYVIFESWVTNVLSTGDTLTFGYPAFPVPDVLTLAGAVVLRVEGVRSVANDNVAVPPYVTPSGADTGDVTHGDLAAKTFQTNFPASPQGEFTIVVVDTGATTDYSGAPLAPFDPPPPTAAPSTPTGFTAVPVQTGQQAQAPPGGIGVGIIRERWLYVFYKVLADAGPYTLPALSYPAPAGSPPSWFYPTNRRWDSLTTQVRYEQPSNLSDRWGRYHTAYIEGGNVHYQRSDSNRPPFAEETQVTSAAQDREPRLLLDWRQRLRLVYTHDDGTARIDETTSDDRGETWETPVTVFATGSRPTVVEDPVTGTVLYACYRSGQLKGKTQGRGETSLSAEFTFNVSGGSALSVDDSAFQVSPARDGSRRWLLIAAVSGVLKNYVSTDDARTWSEVT